MFNENGQDSKYWSNSPPISETALSYIPENVWNESSLANGLWAGSGGASAGNVPPGVGTTPGVPKPDWQYGVTGIPADGVRDLPDVSLTAAGHDPYLLCLEGSCVPNNQGYIYVYFVSGTSASAPSFAGIMALVADQNSRTTGNPRLGLANYVLYRLAALQSGYPSQCNGSNVTIPPVGTCIFNDVTVGNNVVPGELAKDYQASVGYDLTTGLGSVNVANLVSQWNTVTFNPTTTGVSLGLSTITHGSPMPFTITVTPSSGTGVPSGEVFLFASGSFGYSPQPTNVGPFALSGGSVTSSTNLLPGGTYFVTANYSGDTTFAPSTSPGSNVFTVNAEPSTTTVSVLTMDQNGNPIPFTGGPFGSFVYLRADVAGQSGYGVATGTVTFSDSFGAIPGGSTFALNSQGNTATPNGILNIDTGTHGISAAYNPGADLSFNASSSTQPVSFTITPGFYAAVPSTQVMVVISAPGGTGQSSVTVSNSTNFSGTISLACSGLPSEATCSFTPSSSITANGTAGTATATILVTTTAPTAMLRSQGGSYFLAQWTAGLGLLLSTIAVGRRQHRVRGLLLLLTLALVIVAPACGGGGSSGPPPPPPNPGTPKGTYSITVSATSGSIVSKTGFALIVR
jgi:hypothetical protein